jgi:penicillin-binding protein 1A
MDTARRDRDRTTTTTPRRKGARPSGAAPKGTDGRVSASKKKSGVAAKPSGVRVALRWALRAAIALVSLVVLGALSIVAVLWYYGRDLPSMAELRDYHPPQLTRVVDRDGDLLGESWVERRTVVSIERVPRVLVLSVLAAEDADFYRHEGLDYPGLVRAFVRGVLDGGRFRGTSTISQQVIKNLVLGPERTMTRKVRELLLARQLEHELTKEEILELYLNHVNFGHGRYGVQEAARYYFGKDVDELSLAEASLIAGIPQSPTHLSPRTDIEAARRRQSFVLDQLAEKRDEYWPDLSLEEIEAARTAEVVIVPPPETGSPAPELMVQATRMLRAQVGAEAARRGGYVIHTTIDRELQASARAALLEGLMALDERQRLRFPVSAPERRRPMEPVGELVVGRTYDAAVTGADDEAGLVLLDVGGHEAEARASDAARFNPENLPPSRMAEVGARVRVSIQELDPEGRARARLELGPEGSIVIVDPRTRHVLALVGGSEARPGFDRATQAVRQPGSTFKPFVYGAALRTRRYTPATLVIDAPGVYDDWRPDNYETWSFEGELRMREALARSINQVAIRVMEDVTPPEVVTLAQALGITTELEPTLALALGASDVRPIELVNAYATLAAGGRFAPTRLITRIQGPDGRDVALPELEEPREAMTPAEAYLLTSLLTSVVDRGTAVRARSLNRPIAGKTGTSNEARDAWFVGFTPDLVAGVWVGFDDRRSLGRRESGARSALPIWIEVMRGATEGRPRVDFPVPSGIVTARIDPRTGLLAYEGQADAIDEYFLDGTVPTEVAPEPGVLDPNDFLMEEMGTEPEAPEAPPPPEAPVEDGT